MFIYSVSQTAQGIERFIHRVQQLGNHTLVDQDTNKLMVYSRFEDAHYGSPFDLNNIRTQEIGRAVAEIEELNTPEQLQGERRPASLVDILSSYKNPVEAVAKPYDEEDEEGIIEENNDDLAREDEKMRELEENEGADTGEDYNQSMPALHEAAQTISNAKRDRILKVVQETLGNDLTDVSDILLMLSETAELKKALSAILALLSIEVSTTSISRDYKVQSKVLRFAADRSESLESYRRGIAETFIRIKDILVSVENTAQLEATVKGLENSLETERRTHSLMLSRHKDEITQLQAQLSPPALKAASFLVFWEGEECTAYLVVEANAPNAAVTPTNKNPPFEAATKRCSVTFKQSQAHKFSSLESAQNQVTSLTKHAASCPFFQGAKPTLSIARLGLDIVG